METPPPDTPENSVSNSTIDASQPFHSVKEAVAVLGTRLHPPSPLPSKPDSSPGSQLASPTHELKQNPGDGAENGVSEFTPPSSDKTPSFFSVGNGISTSSELNKTYLGDAIKEVVSEPTTPSPINPKNPSIITYPTPSPTPSVSCEMGISEPATPSISSKEIEPSNNEGKTVHGNDLVMMLMLLRRLESELKETKMELKELKERESETEVAVASLNAELHKNMSKIAKAADKSGPLGVDDEDDDDDGGISNKGASSRWRNHGVMERSNSEVITKQVDSPTLAQILSITDYDCYFENSNKLKKKKPIIPLITDVFPWRKRSPSSKSYHSASVFSWR